MVGPVPRRNERVNAVRHRPRRHSRCADRGTSRHSLHGADLATLAGSSTRRFFAPGAFAPDPWRPITRLARTYHLAYPVVIGGPGRAALRIPRADHQHGGPGYAGQVLGRQGSARLVERATDSRVSEPPGR